VRRAGGLLAAALLLALVGSAAAQGSYEVLVHGIVQDTAGQAVKGGQVRLYRNDTGAGTLVRTATLASNAWQFWEKLTAGEYSIIYIPPEGWACAADEKTFSCPADAARYPPPPGTSADLVFTATRLPPTATPTATLATPQASSLIVRCLADGVAVAGVTVTLTWGTTAITRTTDAAGNAVLPLTYGGAPILLVARTMDYLCLGFEAPAGIEVEPTGAVTYAVSGTPVTPPAGNCQARVLSVAPDAGPLVARMRAVATATATVPKTGTPSATFCTQTPTATLAGICTQCRHILAICTHIEVIFADGETVWVEGECVGGKK